MSVHQSIAAADVIHPAACLHMTLSQVVDLCDRDAGRRFVLGRSQADWRGQHLAKLANLKRLGFLDAKGKRTQLAREAMAQPGRIYGEALVWAYGFNDVNARQIGREIVEQAFGSADGLTDDIVRAGRGVAA